MPSSGTAEAPKAPKHDEQTIPKEIEDLVKLYSNLSRGEYVVSIYIETIYSQKHLNNKYVNHYGIIHRRGLGIEEAKEDHKYKTPRFDSTSDVETYIRNWLNEHIKTASAAPRQTRSKTR